MEEVEWDIERYLLAYMPPGMLGSFCKSEATRQPKLSLLIHIFLSYSILSEYACKTNVYTYVWMHFNKKITYLTGQFYKIQQYKNNIYCNYKMLIM